MRHFKDIEIEGFGSILGPLRFELDRGNSLSIIRGEVGSGKTSLPSALCWGLFGKTLKDKSTVETWVERRSSNFRGTKVVVNWEDNNHSYTVIRCKSFKGKITIGKNVKVNGGNNLFLLIDGKSYQDGKGKVNAQDNIEKVLGYSFELFKNSIVFGQKMKRIIEESGPNKKKLFEEAFEAGFIEDAKSKVTIDKDKLNNTFNLKQNTLESLENQIISKEELYSEALDNEKNFEKRRKKRLKEIEDEISDIEKEIKDLKSDKKKIKIDKNISSKIYTLESEISKHKITNKEIDEVEDEIEDSKENILKHQEVLKKKPKLCPSCKQPLSTKGYENMVASAKSAISILNHDIKKLEYRIKGLNKIDVKPLMVKLEALKKAEIIQNNNKSNTEKDKEKLEKLTVKKSKYQTIHNNLSKEKIKLKSVKYKKELKTLNKELSKLKVEIESIQKELDIKQWLINDPLSNNGLKAYIFDNLLNKVNDRLDEYSVILGFQVEFGIDLESHRKDFYQAIMKDDIVIPYEDLSGGQKQLVDTSVAFAIHDVISEIRPTNIMFMDEPFESLGLNEIEIVSELVQEKAKNKSLFLITHHPSFNPMNTNDIIVSLDENGNTNIY